MSRFSRLILILLLGFEAGCQNARFWKRGSDQADRKATAAKADGKVQKKDADESKFSFAGLTRRKQESSEKESDQAEPLIAEQEQQVEQLVKQGQQALEKNDLDGAQQAYREILLLDPTHAAANHGLAMAADLEHRWKDAEYYYLQALKASPQDANILSDLGYSCLLQQRFAEATRYLNQALEADAQHENARVNLALLDLQLGRPDAAEQRVRELYGDTARAAEMMSQLQYQANEAGGHVRREADVSGELPEVPAGLPFEQVQELARQQRDASLRRRVQENAGRPIPPGSAGWSGGAGVDGSAGQYPESGWPVPQPDQGIPSMPPLDTREAAQAGYRGQWPAGPSNARTAGWNQPQQSSVRGGFPQQQAIQPSSWVQPAPYGSSGGYPTGGSTGMTGGAWGGVRPQTPGAAVAPAAPIQTGSPVPIRSGSGGVVPGAQSYGAPAGMQIRGPQQPGGTEGWGQAGPMGPQAGYDGASSGWENLPLEGLNAGPGNLFPVYGDQPEGWNMQAGMMNAGQGAVGPGVQPAGFTPGGRDLATGPRAAGGDMSASVNSGYYGPPRSVLPGQELSDQMSAQAAERAAMRNGYDAWPDAVPSVAPMQAYELQRESIHQQYRGMQQSQQGMERRPR
ncbi:MAG: tetratricopeptide repeat protein [Planctomyces sp.]